MSQQRVERRGMPRYDRFEKHRIVAAHVRPGHVARIIDVCAGGALIETGHRLLPGTSVELHVETHINHMRVRGLVLRSAVVQVRPSAVSYRGAIRFDRHLPWFLDASGLPSSTTEARPAYPARAIATPEVM